MGELPNAYIEIIGEVNLYLALVIKVIFASILGGLIGLDREKKMKSAGLKTNMLICIGATLYTSISIALQKATGGMADPNRVAAQVVSGIGFLGAGAIMRGRGNVLGLTTAATIWVVAAIGVAIGSGYPIVGIIFTLTILVVLNVLNPVYDFIVGISGYRMEVLTKGRMGDRIKDLLDTAQVDVYKFQEKFYDESKNLFTVEVDVETSPKKVRTLNAELRKLLYVESVSFRELDVHESEEES